MSLTKKQRVKSGLRAFVILFLAWVGATWIMVTFRSDGADWAGVALFAAVCAALVYEAKTKRKRRELGL